MFFIYKLGIGDWGFGDGGWGFWPLPQPPIPKPPHPTPPPQINFIKHFISEILNYFANKFMGVWELGIGDWG